MADTVGGEAVRRPRKAPGAFRTISEVASDLDVPQHVLRFWETKFNQIKPLKRAGGRRYYRPEDIELLRRIRSLLYTDGYTIRGVQKLLRETGAKGLVAGEAQEEPEKPEASESSEPEKQNRLSADQRNAVQEVLSELTELRELLRKQGN